MTASIDKKDPTRQHVSQSDKGNEVPVRERNEMQPQMFVNFYDIVEALASALDLLQFYLSIISPDPISMHD